VEAARWYRPAAEQGLVDAQFNLALLYTEPGGVGPDFDEAARWFRTAAQSGDTGAQLALARLYEQGLGRPVNLVQAYIWARRAENNGVEEAEVVRKRVAALMSPEELDEARRMTVER
jgi:TPR repeat protein